MKLLAVIFLIVLQFFSLRAQEVSGGGAPHPAPFLLYNNYKLPDLQSFVMYNTTQLRGKRSLWIFFQPECQSCEIQLRDLRCLPQDIIVLAVGYSGHRESLKKVLRFTEFHGPQLMATEKWVSRLQLRQTPTVLLVDSEGRESHRFVSRVPCEEIKKFYTDTNVYTETKTK